MTVSTMTIQYYSVKELSGAFSISCMLHLHSLKPVQVITMPPAMNGNSVDICPSAAMLSYCLGQHDIRDLTTQRYKTFDKLEQCHISFTIITLEHASVIPKMLQNKS